MITFFTTGVCSKKITFDIEDNIVKDVKFTDGCHGNLLAISKLIEGKSTDYVIELFKGIQCGGRGTSCPDQLAKAIENALKR